MTEVGSKPRPFEQGLSNETTQSSLHNNQTVINSCNSFVLLLRHLIFWWTWIESNICLFLVVPPQSVQKWGHWKDFWHCAHPPHSPRWRLQHLRSGGLAIACATLNKVEWNSRCEPHSAGRSEPNSYIYVHHVTHINSLELPCIELAWQMKYFSWR